MNVDVIDSLEALEALEPEWLHLWQRCPRATPFQSPQWLLPWTRHLFGGGTIWVLAMREGDRLIGLAPLFRWGIDRLTVSFLGAGISDYGDLLFDEHRESECVAAVCRFLDSEQPDWDLLDLQELRCGSGMLKLGAAQVCSVCPVLELSSYPASIDPKHRIDVRRAGNRLRKLGNVEFTTADHASFPQHFAEFVRLYSIRWASLAPPLQRFHGEAAAKFLAAGNLRLSLLWLNGTALAATYCFTAGETLYCYLSGFDAEKAQLSPGAVLLGWVIGQAAAEGMQRVDFLRKTERYKYLWGAVDWNNYQIRRTSGRTSDIGRSPYLQ